MTAATEDSLRLEGVDRALAAHWHPVALRSEVLREPFGTMLLGVPLVLFEGQTGSVHCFRDLCVHRGAALSQGTVVHGRLRCPFHGWEYEGSGACTLIPQLDPEEKIPAKARAFAYECEVHHGLVWVRLIPADTTVPAFPEWSDPQYLTAMCLPFTWQATAPRMVENFTDFAHLSVVHPGILADPDKPEVPHHVVERDRRSLHYSIELPLKALGDGEGSTVAVEIEYELTAPFSIRTTRRQNGLATRSTFFAVQPLDGARGRAFMALAIARPDDSVESTRQVEEQLRAMVELQDVVQKQDQPIVEAQRPENLPFDLSDELHLRFDRVSVQYRHLLRSLGLMA